MKSSFRFFLVATLACSAGFATETLVERTSDGRFRLIREGKPYTIRGACGARHLDVLKEHGGNSIRTYGVDQLEATVDGKPLLDRCADLSLTVAAGLWIAHERHGFDYNDPAQVERQRQQVRASVRQYKDHPALLLWSLGNEMEGDVGNPRASLIFRELNELAAIVKAEDPSHPVMTVIAGASSEKVNAILGHCPQIDILGVNAYAAAGGAAESLRAAGWNKPFVLAEFGPPGHWEVPKTSWGAPIEPSSREKAAAYYATQKAILEEGDGFAIGGYCFIWGQKQETTSTWYGMFLKSGEKLPQVDAMTRAWTDAWPGNRCPRVERFITGIREATVEPGQLFTARVDATDPDGDTLTYGWVVTAESTDRKAGGDLESEPRSFPDAIVKEEKGEVVLRTPGHPGNYRLFVVVRDGRGAASAENVCFRVEGSSR